MQPAIRFARGRIQPNGGFGRQYPIICKGWLELLICPVVRALMHAGALVALNTHHARSQRRWRDAVREAAERLGLSYVHLDRAIRRGPIPAYTPFGRRRFVTAVMPIGRISSNEPFLPPLPQEGRRDENDLRAEFAQILPGILGALYDGVAAALRNWETVERPREFRMADAVRWIRACEEALGFEAGAVLSAIQTAQSDLVVERVNDESVVIHLRRVIRHRAFEGYMADPFAELDARPGDRSMPQSPSRLSSLLARLRPGLAAAGINVTSLGKDRKGMRVRVDLAERDPNPPPAFVQPPRA